MTTFASTQDGVASNVTTEAKTIQVGRTRAYGIHYVGTATAGTIELKDGTTSKVKIDHGAVAEFKTNLNSVFTTEQVTKLTVFHSGGSNS
jgi:hypothetical protein